MPQREIAASKITETVARLCQQANYFLPEDVWHALEESLLKEKSATGRGIFLQTIENAQLATRHSIALCQDTGIAEIFISLGQDVHVTGGGIKEAINKGVAKGYKEGHLRMSMVQDPFNRKNTGDNTPAQISIEIVAGDKINITILPKGGGSENASALAMLEPSGGWQAVKEFVLGAVRDKGMSACPPLIVGVGIGGSFSTVAQLSKKALLRSVGQPSEDVHYAKREKELLKEINALGFGPMGIGGSISALAVHIDSAPCHIACLPVAVCLQCHSCRKRTDTI